jgi:hypothetical protein
VGARYQNSPLVYGWRRPANPPLVPEDWAVSHKYVDEGGKNRRLGKDYQRTGLWELPAEYWEGNGCLSPLDYWTRWIETTGVLQQQVRRLGPFYRREWQLQSFLRQLTAEERRWQETLWVLYDLTAAGTGWGTPEFEAALDRLVPQSRGSACANFYGDTCPHVRLCDHEAGWEDPALMGMVMRRPHHAAELQQAIGRGMLPPEMGAAEYGED